MEGEGVTKAGYHPGEGLVWLGLIAGGECP